MLLYQCVCKVRTPFDEITNSLIRFLDSTGDTFSIKQKTSFSSNKQTNKQTKKSLARNFPVVVQFSFFSKRYFCLFSIEKAFHTKAITQQNTLTLSNQTNHQKRRRRKALRRIYSFWRRSRDDADAVVINDVAQFQLFREEEELCFRRREKMSTKSSSSSNESYKRGRVFFFFFFFFFSTTTATTATANTKILVVIIGVVREVFFRDRFAVGFNRCAAGVGSNSRVRSMGRSRETRRHAGGVASGGVRSSVGRFESRIGRRDAFE
tara:strand:+ start:567 stop:1361 length:795 start_codon:yes stop_codon:yes gene_type:complete